MTWSYTNRPPPRATAGRIEGWIPEAVAVSWRRYRTMLQATAAASAGPYGYTLTIWTSGAVLAHARGIPSTRNALLFLVGAVAAYAIVGGVAFGGFSEEFAPDPSRLVVWGALHFFSVGLAITAASLVAHFVEDAAAWPLGGLLATALYLLGSAFQLVVAHASRPDRRRPA